MKIFHQNQKNKIINLNSIMFQERYLPQIKGILKAK